MAVTMIAKGNDWELLYDDYKESSWLLIGQEAQARCIPDDLAELIQTAWERRHPTSHARSLEDIVLDMFKELRWGELTADGVQRVLNGTGSIACTHVHVDAPLADIRAACEQLAAAGHVVRRARGVGGNYVVYELDRKKFPVEDRDGT